MNHFVIKLLIVFCILFNSIQVFAVDDCFQNQYQKTISDSTIVNETEKMPCHEQPQIEIQLNSCGCEQCSCQEFAHCSSFLMINHLSQISFLHNLQLYSVLYLLDIPLDNHGPILRPPIAS